MARAPLLGDFEIVLEEDQEAPSNEKTTWILKVLNFEEREVLMRRSIDPSGSLPIGSMNIARLSLGFGLKGWRNFKEADGKNITFKAEGEGLDRRIPEYLLDKIGPYAVELTNAIVAGVNIPGLVAKNSTSP